MARRVEARGFKVGVRSLYGWWRRYNRLGAAGQIVGVEGLVDRYERGDYGRGETRSPEAVAFFYDLYRTENKVAIAVCHEVTLHDTRRRGCNTPSSSIRRSAGRRAPECGLAGRLDRNRPAGRGRIARVMSAGNIDPAKLITIRRGDIPYPTQADTPAPKVTLALNPEKNLFFVAVPAAVR